MAENKATTEVATKTIRVALAQMNPRVGDLRGNADSILKFTRQAVEKHADVVVFPELALTGYPPEDLLYKSAFQQSAQEAMAEIVRNTQGVVSVVGFAEAEEGLYNAAAVIHNGSFVAAYRKCALPNYGVFDEKRYFYKGLGAQVFLLDTVRFGINICEDIWLDDGPALAQTALGAAQLILVLNASPYDRGKLREREEILAQRARSLGCAICYVNTVGAQDDLVFDGQSLIVGANGATLARARAFEEQLLVADVALLEDNSDGSSDSASEALPQQLDNSLRVETIVLPGSLQRNLQPVIPGIVPPLDELEEAYQALMVGTRDYVRKNSFPSVILGLSGGIDSALTLAVACDALGPERVTAVSMPGRFTSAETRKDAEHVADNFGVRFLELPIDGIFESYQVELEELFKDGGPGLAYENLQARIRGNLLMALSNKESSLVLTCGNKSEMAVGYATLYGDMAGGFAVLKDVYKTLVWKLARWRNRDSEVIPPSIIHRAPSAELRPGQKDTDSLPPYDILDGILLRHIEGDQGVEAIVSQGFDRDTVLRVVRLVRASEYKRAQAPPGVRITSKAFGSDWRMPLTNAFRDGDL